MAEELGVQPPLDFEGDDTELGLMTEAEELAAKVDHLWAHHMADHDIMGEGV